MASLPGSMVGRTLGHYRIVEQIGAGGMGIVHRAHDERLERDVALKVLLPGTLGDETARRRFRKEALALSRLNHPNVATVFDFDTQEGIDFLVTELVSGPTLDEKLGGGPLPEKEVVQLGSQLAAGLEAAHSEGVIHRDLKPGNLRMTPEGRLKILDFGLAKRVDPAGQGTLTDSVLEGGPVGTLPYMAPEQVLNEKLDARADIWAAGVLLYELATGRRPFEAKATTALVNDILHRAPTPAQHLQPKLSPRLADIIDKCLEKDPENRYQTVRDLLIDLRRLGLPSSSGGVVAAIDVPSRRRPVPLWTLVAAGAIACLVGAAFYFYPRRTGIHSVAVMPFENGGADSNVEFIGDGIAEETINHLTQVPQLKVIARPTAFAYKGRKLTPQAVGKELGVAAVVLGRVEQRGSEYAVQVDIVDTSDGSEVWGGHFQRPASEIQSIQTDIVLQVTDKLRLGLTGEQEQRLNRRQTNNSEAYKLYLQGRLCITEVDFANMPRCLDFFQRAVGLDPGYAQAWAGLADAYAYQALSDLAPPAQAMARARQTAMKALQLDETVSEAHTSLGIIKLCYDWDAPAAEAEFRRALDLSPGDVFSRHWHAHYMEITGQLQKANSELREIVELDPLAKMYTTDLAIDFYFMRQPADVVQMAKDWNSPQSMGPELWTTLAQAYEQLGRRTEAVEILDKGLAGDNSVFAVGTAAAIMGRLGQKARGEKLLAALQQRTATEYVPAGLLAIACFGMDDDDQGFRYLERALQERGTELLFAIPHDPELDHMRRDPRYAELLRKYGFSLYTGLSPR